MALGTTALRSDRYSGAAHNAKVGDQGERSMNETSLKPEDLRAQLVAVALEWERRYGVAPGITSAISEYDAARLVGHSAESFGRDCVGRTAVTPGADFCHNNVRYQVKANRPSGKPGSFVRLVSKAKNYDWDRLIWLLYDREFRLQEAWEWTASKYRKQLGNISYVRPSHMRKGRQLQTSASKHDVAVEERRDDKQKNTRGRLAALRG